MNKRMHPAIYIICGIIIIAVELFVVVANLLAGAYNMSLVTGFVLIFAGILLVGVGIKNLRNKN